ncbi:CDGSH iron-sulfur domain-containing protein [Nocardioides yefusunii]|uniref:CDGSH iron-sulfur domain-containing protein n=1 Tax=Nocardioides yefusunii TaxID=2500546 RepID=A0ABW1QWE0_9ACTN|nr:CDGSH iron-sulfur domain-containing protein [Nocardioides yefusunii]
MDRPAVAVCRCLRSSLLPWCDGTHKVLSARLLPED